jgi:hypothetical protein
MFQDRRRGRTSIGASRRDEKKDTRRHGRPGLELKFENDLRHAREIRLGEHLARPFRERLVEWVARLAEPLM